MVATTPKSRETGVFEGFLHGGVFFSGQTNLMNDLFVVYNKNETFARLSSFLKIL